MLSGAPVSLLRIGIITKFAAFPPIEAPTPREERLERDCRSATRELDVNASFDESVVREADESAERARWDVGVEILYGAFVFERTWISGGCAMAIPSLIS